MLVEMGTIPCQGEEEPRLGHGQLCHGAPWGRTACGGTKQSRGITGLGSMGVQGRGAGGAVAEQHYAPTTAPTALLTAHRAPGAATDMKDLLFKFTSEIQPLPEFPGSSDRQQEV